MSFEFYGGILALDVLKQHDCPVGQAESVAEAIIRHQDPVEVGTISTIGLLVQLATQYGQCSLDMSREPLGFGVPNDD
jgi:cyanamide hydratase